MAGGTTSETAPAAWFPKSPQPNSPRAPAAACSSPAEPSPHPDAPPRRLRPGHLFRAERPAAGGAQALARLFPAAGRDGSGEHLRRTGAARAGPQPAGRRRHGRYTATTWSCSRAKPGPASRFGSPTSPRNPCAVFAKTHAARKGNPRQDRRRASFSTAAARIAAMKTFVYLSLLPEALVASHLNPDEYGAYVGRRHQETLPRSGALLQAERRLCWSQDHHAS
jgi:hypothetical protein